MMDKQINKHEQVAEEFKELYRFGTARLTCIPELLLQDVLQAAEHRFVLS